MGRFKGVREMISYPLPHPCLAGFFRFFNRPGFRSVFLNAISLSRFIFTMPLVKKLEPEAVLFVALTYTYTLI